MIKEQFPQLEESSELFPQSVELVFIAKNCSFCEIKKLEKENDTYTHQNTHTHTHRGQKYTKYVRVTNHKSMTSTAANPQLQSKLGTA